MIQKLMTARKVQAILIKHFTKFNIPRTTAWSFFMAKQNGFGQIQIFGHWAKSKISWPGPK